MSEADRLPPVLQRRMARLALKGWTFAYEDGLYGMRWTAKPPHSTAVIPRVQLVQLISDLVGYDA